MSRFDQSPPLEAMLAHSQFLHALVRSLMRGESDADDVVQETFMRAWQDRSPRRGSLRGWLARIAQHLAIDYRRAAQRRERLSGAATAAGASAPTPDEVLQQEEQRQRVVHAVLALQQPYRTVVLLRYWEGLEPAAIAFRLGVPGARVRSQLLRGLQLLRKRLDAEYGDRSAWIAALIPFAARAPVETASVPTLGALIMTKTKTACAFAALVLVPLLGWMFWPDAPRVAPDMDRAVHARGVPASADLGTTSGRQPENLAGAAMREPVAPAGGIPVHGQVLQQGLPFGGLTLRVQWFDGVEASGAPIEEHMVRCDDEGRFAWIGPPRDGIASVRAVAPGQPVHAWCTARVVTPGQLDVALEVSVMALDRMLHGLVRDQAGMPVAGARLTINQWENSAATSDTRGAYQMRVPAHGYPLIVKAKGYLMARYPNYLAPEAMSGEFHIDLAPGAELRGRVVDEQRAPGAGAKVFAAAALASADTDAEGRFVLDGLMPGGRAALSVNHPDYRLLLQELAVDRDVELVLMRGVDLAVRVVGPNAEPVAGAAVGIKEAGAFGQRQRKGVSGPDGRLRLRSLAPGTALLLVEKRGYPDELREIDAGKTIGEVLVVLQRGNDLRGLVVDQNGRPVPGASVYCQRNAAPLALSSVGTPTHSDGGGRFATTGLPAEACTVYAQHPDSTRASAEFVGGIARDVVLRLEPAPAVAGRAIDATTGAPVGEFRVAIETQGVRRELEIVRSDDGSFAVRDWRLEPGAEVGVEVTADGYATASATAVALVDPYSAPLVIRMFRGA